MKVTFYFKLLVGVVKDVLEVTAAGYTIFYSKFNEGQ